MHLFRLDDAIVKCRYMYSQASQRSCEGLKDRPLFTSVNIGRIRQRLSLAGNLRIHVESSLNWGG